MKNVLLFCFGLSGVYSTWRAQPRQGSPRSQVPSPTSLKDQFLLSCETGDQGLLLEVLGNPEFHPEREDTKKCISDTLDLQSLYNLKTLFNYRKKLELDLSLFNSQDFIYDSPPPSYYYNFIAAHLLLLPFSPTGGLKISDIYNFFCDAPIVQHLPREALQACIDGNLEVLEQSLEDFSKMSINEFDILLAQSANHPGIQEFLFSHIDEVLGVGGSHPNRDVLLDLISEYTESEGTVANAVARLKNEFWLFTGDDEEMINDIFEKAEILIDWTNVPLEKLRQAEEELLHAIDRQDFNAVLNIYWNDPYVVPVPYHVHPLLEKAARHGNTFACMHLSSLLTAEGELDAF